MGDFSIEICEPDLAFLCTTYNFKNLVHKPICY